MPHISCLSLSRQEHTRTVSMGHSVYLCASWLIFCRLVFQVLRLLGNYWTCIICLDMSAIQSIPWCNRRFLPSHKDYHNTGVYSSTLKGVFKEKSGTPPKSSKIQQFRGLPSFSDENWYFVVPFLDKHISWWPHWGPESRAWLDRTTGDFQPMGTTETLAQVPCLVLVSRWNVGHVPSGKHTKSYWKWP